MGSIADKPCEILYRDWVGKCPHDGIPCLDDLDPVVDIPALVSNLMIFERGPDGFRYRIVGTRVVENIATGMKGQPIESVITVPKLRRQWLAILDEVARGHDAHFYAAVIPRDIGASFHALLMPLSDGTSPATHLLVGVFFSGFLPKREIVQELVRLPQPAR